MPALPHDTLPAVAQTVQGYSAISVNHFVPELILGAGFLLAILLDAVTRKASSKQFSILFAIGVLAIAGIFSALEWHSFDPSQRQWQPGFLLFPYSQTLFGPLLTNGVLARGYGMVVVDNFSVFFKLLVSIGGIIALLMSLVSQPLKAEPNRFGEYASLVLGLCIGLYLMPASTDLIMIYLALELSSIAGYVLAGFHRSTEHGAEGSLKYILFGAISSGAMLYGFSLFYGLTGTTNMFAIRQILTLNPAAHAGTNLAVLWTASTLALVGIGYKISAFPFHFWTPDVYEGAPVPITALLSTVSKAAGFGLLIRFTFFLFPSAGRMGAPMIDWPTIFAIGAAITMTFGNLAALLQTNVRRMLAYSTIAHSGYMLAALATGKMQGIVAVMIYLVVYLFMQMGAFFSVMLIENKIGSEDISSYRGLMLRSPLICSAFVVFLISLTGIPVTAGFIGKFYLLTALLQPTASIIAHGASNVHSVPLLWLAILLIVNSVISLYYYLRVASAMFLKRPVGSTALENLPVVMVQPLRIRYSVGATVLMVTLLLPVIVLGIYFQPLVDFASGVVRFFNF